MSRIKENKNKIFVCPNGNCISIPEISYSYEPLNSSIKYKCNNTKSHILVEDKMKLEDFLKKTSATLQCSICNSLIFGDEFIFSKNNKVLYHIDCLKKYGLTIDDSFIKINANYLFNYCLEHNSKYMFVCQQCQISLCLKCDIEASHSDIGHILLHINSLRDNKNKKEGFKSIVTKQRTLLEKIKDMNKKLSQSLENDITIKEQILENYENNDLNYQSILNFNNFELKKNEKYEKKLDDILSKYKEFENNKKNVNSEEILINTILSPLYYSMMINDNSKYNENIINLFNKKIINMNKEDDLNIDKSKNEYPDIDKVLENDGDRGKKNNLELNAKKKDEINKKVDNNKINKEDNKFIDNIEKNENEIIENKEFNHIEINNIKQEKSIFNMIILHTGNIAISSNSKIIIYDSNNLLDNKETNYLLQQINISKNKKVSYVYEFPDETLFCSSYGKIFHIKLIENDRNYNILGIIELEKLELPSKLISLGDSFLAVLTVISGMSFIRLFIKKKESEEKNKYINNYINIKKKKINDHKNYNSDEQSEGMINDNFIYLDKKDIEKDKEFYPYSENNNLNLDKKLLCSIFEIKNNNNNDNRIEYKFISTSNSIYDYGEDKLIFYYVKNRLNSYIECRSTKKIDISCSTESDSICQLNKHFLCIGLQNHCKPGQINGLALINIKKKEISQIIQSFPIDSLYFNYERKILYSAIDFVESNKKHTYMIGIHKVVEGIDEIYIKDVYKFKTGHNNIIVSLSELKSKKIENIDEERNNKEIILSSASLDTNLKLIKINI